MTEPLYGLSLTQPWATLMALGAKTIETRSWGPSPDRLGKLVAIQAAKAMSDADKEFCDDPRSPAFRVLTQHIGHVTNLVGAQIPDLVKPVHMYVPHGVVVAVGRLTHRWKIPAFRVQPDLVPSWLPQPDTDEYRFGDYSTGRWAWHFTDIEALQWPVPIRGQPLVWEIVGEERHNILSQTRWWELVA